jgi:hypothetical protein
VCRIDPKCNPGNAAVITHRSIEEWRAEFDEVVRRYRLGLSDPRAHEKLSREQALALMRKLGFTTGEALRLLRPKERGE